jgi:IS5 family transposase
MRLLHNCIPMYETVDRLGRCIESNRSSLSPVSNAVGRSAYSGLLPLKMLLVGIWNEGLSDELVENMANSSLHVMRFLSLSVKDDVPVGHSVLSCFRTRLTLAGAWDGYYINL